MNVFCAFVSSIFSYVPQMPLQHHIFVTQRLSRLRLWRASKYIGCAESERDYNGGKCRVQVCRYAKAGNCDMT